MESLEPQLRQLLVLASAGVGAIILAVARCLIKSQSLWLTTAAAASLVVGLIPMSIYDMDYSWKSSIIVAMGAMISTLVQSIWVEKLVRSMRRPMVSAGLMGLTGIVLIVVSTARFASSEADEAISDSHWLEAVTARPDTTEATNTLVVTDLGRRLRPHRAIHARTPEEMVEAENVAIGRNPFSNLIIRRGPASDECNCHGWVFTGGKYWLSNDDVQAILEENGYDAVMSPEPGDLVIYSQGKTISHTAIVRACGPTVPVMVEGKWGCMGVYLHGVDDSLYGKQYTYYRSVRDNHILVGLGGKPYAGSRLPVHELESQLMNGMAD